MNSRETKKQCKVAVRQKIKENKNILFGAFSDKLSKNDKQVVWTYVSNLAHSLGLLPQEKGWEYVRVVLWQNWKKVIMVSSITSKVVVSKLHKTITELTMARDHIILEIVGKDSPLVTSLGVQEIWQSQDATSCSMINEITVQPSVESGLPELSATEEQRDSSNSPVDSTHETSNVLPTKRKHSKPKENEATNDFLEKKRMLQLEYLKLQNYKTKLEILKLGTELGIPTSEFTCDIGQPIDYTIVGSDNIEIANETVVMASGKEM
ncbi:hypothetical protein PR048_004647 [Dryococelus australis]|uniref:Regulatory protein zeste n=1 Tax=Dryococelus australis TaxID=614101 RepID=A0ABQ9I6S9_9NEOP|nr:hypothetical protein PR048_004647 [Dryococelus australis]